MGEMWVTYRPTPIYHRVVQATSTTVYHLKVFYCTEHGLEGWQPEITRHDFATGKSILVHFERSIETAELAKENADKWLNEHLTYKTGDIE